MRTNVGIDFDIPIVSLNRLENLVKELGVLKKKKIEHDERLIKLIKNRKIRERTILVKPTNHSCNAFEYNIKDYGYVDGRRFLVGSDYFTSKNLKK